MRLATLLVLEPNLTVVFSYNPSTTLALDALEASLSAQLRQARALPPCDTPLALVCLDHPVALQRKGDLLYAVAAACTEDELGGAWWVEGGGGRKACSMGWGRVRRLFLRLLLFLSLSRPQPKYTHLSLH
jgi:hypothetical protein